MKMTELFLSELEREVKRSRHALEQVPEGKHDWKPHDKSMIFGYLADMVATIPTWIVDDHQAGRARHRAQGRADAEAGPRRTPARSICRRWTRPPPTRVPRSQGPPTNT